MGITYILEQAQQTCPAFAKTAIAAAGTANFKSASSRIILGLLPPSSSPTFFKLDLALISKSSFPTTVLPVNDILLICMCMPMAFPAEWP